jgi:hypothetical protein
VAVGSPHPATGQGDERLPRGSRKKPLQQVHQKGPK